MMPLVIASSPHSTSSCSRATCRFTRAIGRPARVWTNVQRLQTCDPRRRDVDAAYHIGGISLEYDMVILPELAQMIDNQYKGRLAILYDRVLRHLKMTMDKSNTLWNINLNVLARSMNGILMLFENHADKQTHCSQHWGILQPQNNESGGDHRWDPQPTPQARDARLLDVGQGKEVLCGIARQKASSRSRNGRKRPGHGRRQSGRILDQQVLLVAWPQDNRWWPLSWQRPPHRKCQRRH